MLLIDPARFFFFFFMFRLDSESEHGEIMMRVNHERNCDFDPSRIESIAGKQTGGPFAKRSTSRFGRRIFVEKAVY